MTTAGELLADHVVLSTGARPAADLAAAAGLFARRHGRCARRRPPALPGPRTGVYAAGDCAESRHLAACRAGQRRARHPRQQAGAGGRHRPRRGRGPHSPGWSGPRSRGSAATRSARTGLSEAGGRPRPGCLGAGASDRGHHPSRLFPGAGPIWVKLVVGRHDGRLLGGQIVRRRGRGQAHRRARHRRLERDGGSTSSRCSTSATRRRTPAVYDPPDRRPPTAKRVPAPATARGGEAVRSPAGSVHRGERDRRS